MPGLGDPTLARQISLPFLHRQPAAALEQVRAPIGRLDPVLDHMREGRLDDLARMIRRLGRPVAATRPTAVRGRSPMNTSSTLSATLVHPSAYYAT